jgi:hypothetical protein
MEGRITFATSVGTISRCALQTNGSMVVLVKRSFELGHEKDEITETCVGLHVNGSTKLTLKANSTLVIITN